MSKDTAPRCGAQHRAAPQELRREPRAPVKGASLYLNWVPQKAINYFLMKLLICLCVSLHNLPWFSESSWQLVMPASKPLDQGLVRVKGASQAPHPRLLLPPKSFLKLPMVGSFPISIAPPA